MLGAARILVSTVIPPHEHMAHSPGPPSKATAALFGAALAVVIPAWWWLRR